MGRSCFLLFPFGRPVPWGSSPEPGLEDRPAEPLAYVPLVLPRTWHDTGQAGHCSYIQERAKPVSLGLQFLEDPVHFIFTGQIIERFTFVYIVVSIIEKGHHRYSEVVCPRE